MPNRNITPIIWNAQPLQQHQSDAGPAEAWSETNGRPSEAFWDNLGANDPGGQGDAGDTGTEPASPEGAPVVPAAGSQPTEPAAATAAPTTQQQPAGAPGDDWFSRDYVEDLRNQAATYRTKLRDVEQLFDGWDPADVQVLREALAAGPNASGDEFIRIAEALRESAQPAAPGAGFGGTGDAAPAGMPAGVTMEQVAAFIEQRDSQKAAQAAVDNLDKEAADLGYALGSRDHLDLLSVARIGNGTPEAPQPITLAEAHAKRNELIEAVKQAAIEEFKRQKQEEAANGATVVPPGTQTGVGQGMPEDSKDIAKWARNSVMSMLEASGMEQRA